MLSIGEDNLVAPPPQAGPRAPNCEMAVKDPDEMERMVEEQTAGELVEPHGVINPNEAAIHIHSLDEVLIIMEAESWQVRRKM